MGKDLNNLFFSNSNIQCPIDMHDQLASRVPLGQQTSKCNDFSFSER